VLAAYIICAPSGALPDVCHASILVSSVCQEDFEDPKSIVLIRGAHLEADRHTLLPNPDFTYRHLIVDAEDSWGNVR
jgi:hypothetical protein